MRGRQRKTRKKRTDGSGRAKAGFDAFKQGNLPLALKQLDRALAADPNVVQHQVLRGNILQQMDRLEESATCYQRALAIDEACADAHYNLGNVRREQGHLEDAVRCFEQAIAIQPEHGQAHNNLGNIYRRMKRYEEAIPCFRKAMALKPDWCAPQANLGSTYQSLERYEEAVNCLQRTLELEPDLAVEVYSDLGTIREKQRRMQEAVGYYERAVRLAPSLLKLHQNLSRVYTWQGRYDEALEAVRQVLRLDPRCAHHSDLLLFMHCSPNCDAESIWKESQRWAALHAAPLARHIRPHTNSADPQRRLRIGYVSADLRRHAVSYFFEPVLARHDRQQVETFIYSGVLDPDKVTERLMPLADHWFSTVDLPDEQLAEQIRADGIDILVDLGGHTVNNRLPVFARKPAPAQVTWLGYPDTTGLPVMDYRLTDEWADPVGKTDHLHSEELLRLPGGFSCYQPPGEVEVGPLPALAAGHVTFGSFNDVLKISKVAIEAWAAILRTLPEARLLMKARAFGEESGKKRMIDRFARHGVSSDRLILLPYLPLLSAHLETYRRVDIALDAFPYHGTTTTCETLWMGVPVVTLAGQTHVSRTGVSLLTQLGLEDFIAETPERYVELAVEKARDTDGLRQLRASLRERMANSSLMDYPGFTRKLEDAYRRMWCRWCEKQPQQDDKSTRETTPFRPEETGRGLPALRGALAVDRPEETGRSLPALPAALADRPEETGRSLPALPAALAGSDSGQPDEECAVTVADGPASAEASLRALAIDEASAEAHYNLGNTRREQGRLEDAARCFEQAIAIQPEHGQAHNNLGNIYRQMKRLEEAILCFQKAMALKPDWSAPQLNLGNAYRDLGRYEEAVSCLEQALMLEPALAPAVSCNLGSVRERQWRMEEAVANYEQAVRLAPSMVEAHGHLAKAYTSQGRHDEAMEAIRQVLLLDPGCAHHSDLLLFMHCNPNCDAESIWKESQRWAALHAAPLARHIRPHTNTADPERRLRIGYVSANLRRHPVSYFLEPVLARHDRQQVETFIYSGVLEPDEITTRLMPLPDHWRSTVGLSDEDLAARIRADGIDILLDLAGHTGENRLLVFARKPAPVQVTWLGYPDTTGLPVMDYRLTDEWADPPGATDHLHSEELVRLPGGFSCYQPPREAPEVAPLPALAAGRITFGAFNNLRKLSKIAVEAWAGILCSVPEAQLLIKAGPLADEATRRRIIEKFARCGVSSDRLILLPHVPSVSSHLEAYGQVDLALDTFPYHGTTTTCEALWMGVPVLTLAGETHTSRTGVSLLTQVGLQEFIAETPERYVELAVEKARDLDALRRLRGSLRERMANSSLMDSSGFTRKLEAAYRQLWRRWCETQTEEDQNKGAALPVEKQSASTRVGPADRPDSTGRKAEQLRQRVAGFPFWYHRIELPGGVVTPGWAPLSHKTHRIPEDLHGKRVLDVGAWDGYWSFLALKRGARQVVAIDDFSDYLGSLKTGDRRAWATFDLCREALGYNPEQCQRQEMSVYEATAERLGRFDVVFCFGLLYHLRYPLMALDGLSSICNGEIFIESAILDDYSPYRGGLGKGYPGGHVVAEFYPGAEYGGNQTNWWVPTLHCLGTMVQAAGFPEVQAWKLTDEPKDLAHCRGFAHGTKNVAR